MMASGNLFKSTLAVLACAALGLAVPAGRAMAQESTDLVVRIEQLERQIRQLTGTIEELQYRNQQLDEQVKRLTGEIDGRTQGAVQGMIRPAPQQLRPGAIPPPPAAAPPPVAAAPVETPQAPPVSSGGRRGDAFDPTLNPNAPGAPRPLGVPGRRSENYEPPYQTGAAPLRGDYGAPSIVSAEPPIGAPGGREPGTPLDLSTISTPAANGAPQTSRDPAAIGQVATLPPSQSPRDEYDLAYGYLLRKDYVLAEEGLRQFLKKYPSDRMAGDAQFWLGEALFQRQNYREAADAFVVMSKKHEHHPKAPDSLLRLGQSLMALNERELACATFGEVARRYPRAPLNVKQAAEREQKRGRC